MKVNVGKKGYEDGREDVTTQVEVEINGRSWKSWVFQVIREFFLLKRMAARWREYEDGGGTEVPGYKEDDVHYQECKFEC